ncbi:MAG: hypothetical protein AB7G21_09725 [Dehalococcoidia bacterium]
MHDVFVLFVLLSLIGIVVTALLLIVTAALWLDELARRAWAAAPGLVRGGAELWALFLPPGIVPRPPVPKQPPWWRGLARVPRRIPAVPPAPVAPPRPEHTARGVRS